MDNINAPSYDPLRCVPVLELSRLPKPSGAIGSWVDFASSLPSGKMNLLATDGHHLYLGHSRESIAVYVISRSRGTQLIPIISVPVEPPVSINNLRVADFPEEKGGSLLLMAGGRADGQEHASISALRIPRPVPELLRDECSLTTSWSWKMSRACTVTVPLCSAWGLDVHNPTGRFALSANSRKILVLSFDGDNLRAILAGEARNESSSERFPEEILSFEAEPITSTYQNNIPTVKFSPCGNLLASGSIDCSFALHDVKSGTYASGETLYQSHMEESEESFWNEFVWCVHWFDDSAMCEVPSTDNVWLESDMQATRQWRQVKNGLSFHPAPRRSIFLNREDIRSVTCSRNGIARYDDCVEPDPSLGADAARQWYEDQFREHHVCDEYDKNAAASVASQSINHSIPYEDERGEFLERQRKTRKQGFTGWQHGELTDDGDDKKVDGKQERFLLVGREFSLYLYRVIGDRPAKNSMPFVEEVHRLQVFSRPRGYPNSAVLDCLEMFQLSAFVLIARGHGVVLLRVLRGSHDSGSEALRLYTERTFPQPSLNGPWRREHASVIGACILPRGEVENGTDCYELWILWRNGMIEAWELSQERVLDPSVIV
ncbi:unnamed protein product [Chondrus crispus]|uniref:Uncharacterized protein n=1 Tax=Chondrus crispus TaxID=2769 RepID=R7Q3F2_CHOCR|nr:unnamed protein product [Chondrus crispus]CDF32534.1 unnamed protein product [Chondrus crispus]|eukprot:XP_005712199.1 unnamed protein product [Chondrus crispus]